MKIPNYFLQRPSTELSRVELRAFEELFANYIQNGTGQQILYELSVPKWQFLSYLCKDKRILLHGSNTPDISEFEPRKPNDSEEFGNRLAVYAASDGIWAMYFAIVNRRQVTSLVNACFKVVDEDGKASDPYYYFSVDKSALPLYPWQDGTIYILPGDTFEQQPELEERGSRIEIAQWASLVPVKPLAKLGVTPEDFPFLSQMYGHDPKELAERVAANPAGFPWHE